MAAFSWTALTSAANTHIWEHINNLATAVAAAFTPRSAILTGSASLGSSPTIAPFSLTGVTVPAGMWAAGAPTRIVAPVDGVLHVNVTIGWPNSTGERYIGLRSNGTTDIALETGGLASASSFGSTQSGGTGVALTAGQYVEVYVAQTSGSTQTVTARVSARLDPS